MKVIRHQAVSEQLNLAMIRLKSVATLPAPPSCRIEVVWVREKLIQTIQKRFVIVGLNEYQSSLNTPVVNMVYTILYQLFNCITARHPHIVLTRTVLVND